MSSARVFRKFSTFGDHWRKQEHQEAKYDEETSVKVYIWTNVTRAQARTGINAVPLLVVAAGSFSGGGKVLFQAAQLTAIATIARTTAAPDLVSAAMQRAIQQALLEIVDAGASATRDKRGVCEATVGAEHLIFVDAGAPNSPTVTKAQSVVVL